MFVAATMAAALLAPAASAQQAPDSPTDLLISEYVEGSSTNKAVEFANGTDAPVDLATYTLDVFFNGGTDARVFTLSGTVAAGDVAVFADEALAAYADLTTGAGLWNGDDVLVLRNAAGDVVDSFGQVGVDPGDQWGSGDTGAQNNTLRRNDDVCVGDTDPTDAFDPADQYTGFGQDVFDGLGSHAFDCGGPGGDGDGSDAVVNEFSASTAGTDVEYVELYGTPDSDLGDLTVLAIEGDSTSATGTVDAVLPAGTTDADGFLLLDLDPNTLENGTVTLLLVQDFTGAVGDDLDTDDDGTPDVAPWSAVVDGVAVHDGGAGDLAYAETVLGPNYDGVSSFAPGGASRIPDGTDTDTTADWVRNDFDLAGIDGQTGTPDFGEAYNTPGAPNEAVPDQGGGGTGGACGDPTVAIGSVQGSGDATPMPGDTVEVEGVVVGDFQPGDDTDGDLGGFHVQDAGDDDPATSDGIFVYDPGAIDVAVGDLVHVTGTAQEYTSGGSSQTQVGATTVVVCESGVALPDATVVELPMTDDQWEALEGMSVTFPQDLAILEYFNFDRFGELVLGPERQFQPTALFEPGSAAAVALAAANATNRITLDDGLSSQNPAVTRHPNGDPFTLDNRFRGGDLVTNATGVLDETFDLYRIQPTRGADVEVANPRPAVPEVGGSMTVASFNVLNYFTTIDEGSDVCGPTGGQECRGADSAEELQRQQAKIVAALAELDADVVGLIEIQNDDVSVGVLVDALNAELGGEVYAPLETGPIGTDAIKVGFIYKSSTVTPNGAVAILDQGVDPRFLDDKNRPALAQTFVEAASGEDVTVAVNHLKSKGSSCDDVGDPEDPDGQGNCNQVRADAATALVDWMASDPTGTGDDDALIIGDLNSYDKEDPIDVLVDAGWTDLLAREQGEEAYSYVFDGQLGYLDYALANPTVLDGITGAAAWHANADEPDLLDYDTSFKSDEQDAIYAPDPYRASDHDAVLVGLDLANDPPEDTVAPVLDLHLSAQILRGDLDGGYRTITVVAEATDDRGGPVDIDLVRVRSDEPDDAPGDADGQTVNDRWTVDDFTVNLRAERDVRNEVRTYTLVYDATDEAGNVTRERKRVYVPGPDWVWPWSPNEPVSLVDPPPAG